MAAAVSYGGVLRKLGVLRVRCATARDVYRKGGLTIAAYPLSYRVPPRAAGDVPIGEKVFFRRQAPMWAPDLDIPSLSWARTGGGVGGGGGRASRRRGIAGLRGGPHAPPVPRPSGLGQPPRAHRRAGERETPSCLWVWYGGGGGACGTRPA